MTSVRSQAPLLLFLIAVVGCGEPEAAVESFDVSPRLLCAGDTATVSWQARGDSVMLSTNQSMDIEGWYSRRGSLRVAFSDTTTLTIRAIAGKDVSQPGDYQVAVFPDRFRDEVTSEPDSMVGDTLVVAVDTAPPAVWSKLVRIGSTYPDSDYHLLVRHAGREFTLPAAGTPSDALTGAPRSGRWEIWASLESGEQFGGNNPLPEVLRVKLDLVCQRQGG